MFERFLQDARRTVVFSQEEAKVLNHDYIGTEHLLLALTGDHAEYSSQALTGANVTHAAIREALIKRRPRGATVPKGHIPFTPVNKKVLEIALAEATQLNHKYISSGHLLLGILRANQTTATEILQELSVDLDELYRSTSELLKAAPTDTMPRIPEVVTSPLDQSRNLLRDILTDDEAPKEALASAIWAIIDTLDEQQVNCIIGNLKK